MTADLLQHGWIANDQVWSDTQIQGLYQDLLHHLLGGSSQESSDSSQQAASLSGPSSSSAGPSTTRTGTSASAALSAAAVASAPVPSTSRSWMSATAASSAAAVASATVPSTSRSGMSATAVSYAAASGSRSSVAAAGPPANSVLAPLISLGFIFEEPTCAVCAEKLVTPSWTDGCYHRDVCENCSNKILDDSISEDREARCPICRAPYTIVLRQCSTEMIPTLWISFL